MADRVELVAYDSAWPARFAEISDDLRAALGGTAGRIEHVGSTAIPGLSAKPIIDVLVEVADDETARTVAVPALLGRGYNECYWRFDSPPGHFQCVKRDVDFVPAQGPCPRAGSIPAGTTNREDTQADNGAGA